MDMSYASPTERPRGFFASLRLALRIAAGGFRLLWRYPVLAVPLVPILVLVVSAEFSLFFIQSLVLALFVVFAVAYPLMFAFAITGRLLKQIEEGARPSLFAALGAPDTVRMIPRVLALSAVWYGLVTILVIIETAVHAIIGRISDNLADTVVNAIFGTIADALRMAGFMLVAIMTFEDIGLRPAVARLRAVVSSSPIAILGGLVLTKFVGTLSVLAVILIPESAGIFILIPLGIVWVLGMYIEQIFVTGLYLYATRPDSRLVSILLADFAGRELPEWRVGRLGETVV
jgi:hypothetical protein